MIVQHGGRGVDDLRLKPFPAETVKLIVDYVVGAVECVLRRLCGVRIESGLVKTEGVYTLNNGHSVQWTTSLQWTNCFPLPIYYPYISTSVEGTTFEQWTKCLSPTCPLFGGSTVVAW